MTSKKHIQRWAASALLTAAKAIDAVAFALERLARRIKSKSRNSLVSLSEEDKRRFAQLAAQRTSGGITHEQIAEELAGMINGIVPQDLPYGEREKYFNNIATKEDMRRLELAAEWKAKAKKYDG